MGLLHHLTDALVAWGPAGILLLAILDSSGVPVAGVFDAFLVLIAVERPSVAWLCAGIAGACAVAGAGSGPLPACAIRASSSQCEPGFFFFH